MHCLSGVYGGQEGWNGMVDWNGMEWLDECSTIIVGVSMESHTPYIRMYL